MQVNPIGCALGAEIHGVDPTRADAGEIDAIYAALLEHEVVFLRDTRLDDAEHLAFAERFGEPSVFPLSRVMGETAPSFQTIADGPDSPSTRRSGRSVSPGARA